MSDPDYNAIRYMAFDIVHEILSRADRPVQLAEYLTQSLREIIGGRIVALVVCGDEGQCEPYSVVSVCPQRHKAAVSGDLVEAVCRPFHKCSEPKVFAGDSLNLPVELGNTHFLLPLMIGQNTVGYIIIFDLFEENRAIRVLNEISQLLPIAAILLRYSSVYQEMEERLRQSEKMKAVGQLAGGIAHDFNNQLSGILGFSELILQHLNEPRKIEEFTNRILVSAQRSADLTRQLLAFSRKGNYELKPVEINALIIECESILLRSIEKRITISLNLDKRDLFVLGDESQLVNMVLNLVINARDAIPEHGEITISSHAQVIDKPHKGSDGGILPAGKYCKIIVKDNGSGIDENVKNRLFEPFFTTKKQGEGTGLGLAAVWGTVSSHKGAITVDSVTGEGAEFNIILPLSESETVDEVEGQTYRKKLPENTTVLVVDDEKMVLEVICEQLKSAGARVFGFNNPQEACQYFKNSYADISLVVVDMIMPGLDGEEFVTEIWKVDPNAKVVVASGYSCEEKIQKLKQCGIKGFLNKPFQVEEMIEILRRAL